MVELFSEDDVVEALLIAPTFDHCLNVNTAMVSTLLRVSDVRIRSVRDILHRSAIKGENEYKKILKRLMHRGVKSVTRVVKL